VAYIRKLPSSTAGLVTKYYNVCTLLITDDETIALKLAIILDL
jgi:hypothetical protein